MGSMYPSAVGEEATFEFTLDAPVEGVWEDGPADLDIGFGVFLFTATLLAFDGDTETIGHGAGEYAADVENVWTIDSGELVTTGLLGAGGGGGFIYDEPWADDDPLPVVTHRLAGISLGPLRVVFNIIDGDSFDPYTGDANMSATWRVDIVRR